MKTLIFVPTYNERDDAPRMVAALHALRLDADILFVDDSSPDGTGAILDGLRATHPRLHVVHRAGRLGIGSAHTDGIAWAYDHGYERLVTLDGDFSHSPADIPRLLSLAGDVDVVVGSRWMARNSLQGWSIYRRFMTGVGHFLTRWILGLPYDATGAFRVYRLDRIPRSLFSPIRSHRYAFFFESLLVLHLNACRIAQVAIVLPARTYGNSKMTTGAALQSVRILLGLALSRVLSPARFQAPKAPSAKIDNTITDPQNWDSYWRDASSISTGVYAFIASVYRQMFIRSRLHRLMRRTFSNGACVLHAGCGGGQVDQGLHTELRITALDISPEALTLYRRHNPTAPDLRHGDIMKLPFPDASFDGYYSLGVVEHFTADEIARLLGEAKRVLKPQGAVVLFWPHAKATSVMVLGLTHRLLNRSGSTTRLHPAEVSLLTSRAMAEAHLSRAGFRVESYDFGAKDLWIQAAIVARKT
jgi:dolichol-phosphate mannosyltransferase